MLVGQKSVWAWPMRGQKRIPSDQSEAKSSRSKSIIKVLQLARIEGLIKLSLRQMGCILDYKMWAVSVLFPSMPRFCVVLLLLVIGEKSLYNFPTFCLINFLFDISVQTLLLTVWVGYIFISDTSSKIHGCQFILIYSFRFINILYSVSMVPFRG